jgi:hypothetical protein
MPENWASAPQLNLLYIVTYTTTVISTYVAFIIYVVDDAEVT